jgi:hypothetical protein
MPRAAYVATLVSERAQQDGIDQREDGGVGAGPDGQRNNRDGGVLTVDLRLAGDVYADPPMLSTKSSPRLMTPAASAPVQVTLVHGTVSRGEPAERLRSRAVVDRENRLAAGTPASPALRPGCRRPGIAPPRNDTRKIRARLESRAGSVWRRSRCVPSARAPRPDDFEYPADGEFRDSMTSGGPRIIVTR